MNLFHRPIEKRIELCNSKLLLIPTISSFHYYRNFDIHATISVVHLALHFLESSFVIRSSDDLYLIILGPIKYYVYQEIGMKKVNQFLGNMGVLR